MAKVILSDGRPTTAEWPVRVWAEAEIPAFAEDGLRRWMEQDFSHYDFVFCPERKTAAQSFDYVFGYGDDRLFYQRKGEPPLFLERKPIEKITTVRELLEAKIILSLRGGKLLELSYVPSTYYLYDPFLNWLLGIPKDFDTLTAERQNPRPEKLYHESLQMFNYSLAAYRLGPGFQDYTYHAVKHRHKLFPWKVKLEEWLEVPMERGIFQLHCMDYRTECTYLFHASP